MMRCTHVVLMMLCLGLLVVLPCVAQDAPAEPEEAPVADPVLLRYHYEKGEKLTYETKVDGVGSVHVMGQTEAIEMAGEMLVTLLVEEIDEDGNYITSTDVDIAELSVTMSGSPVPPPAQGIQMRTKTSPRGEILEIQFMQTVDQRGAQSPWNSEMAKLLTGGFDLNQMLLGQRLAAFPEEAVKPGDTWKGTAPEVELRGQTVPIEINTRYENNIELNERDCAVLDSAVALDPAGLGQLATMLAMQGSTTTQTRSWFDVEAGRLQASMEKTQVNMQVNVPGALVGAGGGATVFVELFIDTQSKLLPPEAEE